MIVILGHTGFIGGYLLRRLEGCGRQVIGLSRREGDLTRAEEIKGSLAQLPGPFDLVNCAVVNRDQGGNYGTFETNCRMLHNLVEALPAGRCRSFIHLSSVDVYGRQPLVPIRESTSASPDDYYGLAKFTGERLLHLGLDRECRLAILRLPGVYGVADGGRSLVGGLIRKVLAGQPVRLTGQGRLLRDCLAVADLAGIIERLLEEPQRLLVNVATGSSISLLEMVALISEVGGGKNPEIIFAQDGKGEEKGNLLFDVTSLRRYFPEFVPLPLKQGVAEYVMTMNGLEK